MTDKDPYVPLADRLNQDVWHDNFVPKYSALANATPSRVVLIGVWMQFAPFALGSAGLAISTLTSPEDVGVRLIQFIGSVFVTILFGAIVYQQTRRYVEYLAEDSDDDQL